MKEENMCMFILTQPYMYSLLLKPSLSYEVLPTLDSILAFVLAFGLEVPRSKTICMLYTYLSTRKIMLEPIY